MLSSAAVLLATVVLFREDECEFLCVRCCSDVGGVVLLPFDAASVILSTLPLKTISRSTVDDLDATLDDADCCRSVLLSGVAHLSLPPTRPPLLLAST